ARDLAHDRRSSTGITTIMNGIDTELFRRRPRPERRTDAFTFLYFGRPGVSKGIEHLIEAMRHLVRAGTQAKLRLILGTDPHDRYVAIAQAAQEPELRKVVRIDAPIPRSELPEAIAAADCVVVPSLAEGFGFTAVEACAVGTPLVCTNVEPLPNVVSGKVVFVPPGNPEELARGMRTMLEGKYEVIPDRNFSWERAAREYEAIYGEVVR
ncbi:MAG: glycosyltransferase family 4 protein, partial [Patescibacteria group bacterium]